MEPGVTEWIRLEEKVGEGAWVGTQETQETVCLMEPVGAQEILCCTGPVGQRRLHAGRDRWGQRRLCEGWDQQGWERQETILFQIIKQYRGQRQLTLTGGSVGGAPFHPLKLHEDFHDD